jgi:hypothetical protein
LESRNELPRRRRQSTHLHATGVALDEQMHRFATELHGGHRRVILIQHRTPDGIRR